MDRDALPGGLTASEAYGRICRRGMTVVKSATVDASRDEDF
ncbi:MAG: hypothetical protein ABI900_03160 [Betaproteobacteria bacterium]